MRISDWSSDVCSSDLRRIHTNSQGTDFADAQITRKKEFDQYAPGPVPPKALLYDGWWFDCTGCGRTLNLSDDDMWVDGDDVDELKEMADHNARIDRELAAFDRQQALDERSEEHTSELQSLMRISYAVFCLKKKKIAITKDTMYTISI